MGTCLPESDEYYRRFQILPCDEEYIRAVFSEIETSNCSNEYYNNTLLPGRVTDQKLKCANISYVAHLLHH